MAISTDIPVSHFVSPDSIDEALATLHELGSSAMVLAGGTDIMVQIQAGQIQPETLLHIGNLSDLRAIDRKDGALGIGSLVTHHQIATDTELSSAIAGAGRGMFHRRRMADPRSRHPRRKCL